MTDQERVKVLRRALKRLLTVIDEGYTEESQADVPRIVEAHDALAVTAPTSTDQRPTSRPPVRQADSSINPKRVAMTVRELKQKLGQFDDGLRVVTPGFDESCYDDIDTVELINLVFHDEAPIGHRGRHEANPDGEPAVLINF
jgi:hypothetical protein